MRGRGLEWVVTHGATGKSAFLFLIGSDMMATKCERDGRRREMKREVGGEVGEEEEEKKRR